MIYNTLLLAVLAQILRWKIPFCSRERGVKVDPSALAKQQKRANALCRTAISSSAFAAARSARDTSGTSWSENGARQQQFTALYGRRLLLLGESIFRRWFIFYACPTACKIFTPTRCHFVVQNFATYIWRENSNGIKNETLHTQKREKTRKYFVCSSAPSNSRFFLSTPAFGIVELFHIVEGFTPSSARSCRIIIIAHVCRKGCSRAALTIFSSHATLEWCECSSLSK